MRQASEEAVEAMLSHVDKAKADVLVVGMQVSFLYIWTYVDQEVAHAETLGRPICTWRQLITDWVTMRQQNHFHSIMYT